MELYEYIGNAVRARRDELNQTQAELAKTAGVTRSTIANLETGRQQVPLDQLVEIARALGIDYRDLLPSPDLLPRSGVGPITAETVRERAPATASFIERLRQAETDREPNAEAEKP